MNVIAPKGSLRSGCDVASATQVMFVLLGPLMYQEFVVRMGWSPDRWAEFTADLLTAAIFTP